MINWFRRNFTAPGLAALGVLIGGTLIFLWILWAIEQARDTRVSVRAITPAEHCACADLPRGSQEMEEERHGCFKGLYGRGGYRLSHEMLSRTSASCQSA